MKLNREQLIKVLECCSTKIGCKQCPLQPKECISICVTQISKNALSLIKELTEENEKLRSDTVRKMRERLKEEIDDSYDHHGAWIHKAIDQIAEEIIYS